MRPTLALAVLFVAVSCSTARVDPTSAPVHDPDQPTAVALTASPHEEEEHKLRIDGLPIGMVQRAQSRLASGPMPHDALVQEFERQQAMLAVDNSTNVQWTWLGPGNAGGRIRAVLISPQNPSRIWIGSAGGGVWRTDDAGSTWQPMNDFLTALSIGSMALDPADSDHVYAGTGEGFFDSDAGTSNTAFLRGAGIFESFDAGATWARIASTATPAFYFCNRITISPQNGNLLLVATNAGIMRSTDRGTTWTQVHNERTFDIDFHPTDGTRAVAGDDNGAALYSTDGGVTWSAATLPTTAERIELAYARSNPLQVYAAVTNSNGNAITIWRSGNGGQSYTLQTAGAGHATLSVYLSSLWVDPTNSNNLVFGGQQCWRSTDGGVSRTQIQTGAYLDYHIFVEAPGFNGTSNKRLYTGCDGGLYTRADWQSGNWSPLNNGLGITQFYGAGVNPTTGVIVAGAQDNQTARYNGNPQVWTTGLIGGDGTFCSADQTDPNYFYAGYYWFGLQRSNNGGSNWTNIRGNLPNSYLDSNFIPWTLLDPNDQGRMLACGRALWRSNNVKTGSPPLWTQIKAPRTCTTFSGGGPANAHFQENLSCNLSMAQIALGDANLIWAAHNDGEVHKTTNGLAASPTWQLIDGAAGQLPDRWVSSIAIDPANHQRVYLSFLGYTNNNVWRTTDGGTTWQSISGSGVTALPAVPCTWLVQHPRVPNWLFVGTDIGLWCSQNDGASWQPVAGGPVNVPIEQILVKNDRTLLAVTHGRGVYEAVLPSATVQTVGAGCATTVPPVLTASPPIIGTTATMAMSGAAPNAMVFFAYSFGPPLPQAYGSCTLQVDLANAAPYVAGFTTGSGTWTTPFTIPPWGSLAGAEVTAQTFLVNIGGPMLGAGDLANSVMMTLGF